jgi:hypothetical protein
MVWVIDRMPGGSRAPDVGTGVPLDRLAERHGSTAQERLKTGR